MLDEFFAWLESLQVDSKSKLAEAVRYALNEKPNLCTFLQDGNVSIDNNRAENSIRPIAVVLCKTLSDSMAFTKYRLACAQQPQCFRSITAW